MEALSALRKAFSLKRMKNWEKVRSYHVEADHGSHEGLRQRKGTGTKGYLPGSV